ncbi:DHH family phosphoesterase [Sphingobacterium sp. SYP-B4668]|uniref:DHH family phosphoesterase n=1 Tax=Sphingobacterium sp. SYP-B4668 TaxID=2996035 RepID=UPI00053238AC|nr:bifunctional oligoribonuclease/PAP phosphatase NrnA [Sphingobacterium sp. SYP-B4668]
MLTRQQNKEILSKSDKIVITTHHKPDGDALGSSLGLYHWLKDAGHHVNVIVSSDFPAFLDWLPGRDEVLIYPDQPELCQQLVQEAALIFCLDYNAFSRTNVMEQILREAPGKKYMIDHHLDPEGFDDYRLWDSSAAATAQLIFNFIEDCVDQVSEITPTIATCLYAGIMTDTGSFRFRSTTEEVHQIIAKLIRSGARNWEIHESIYNSSTENRLKFLGHCLLNRLQVIPEYNTALFAVAKQDLEQFQVTTGDTEGLVNYALSIKGIRLAALIIDRTELIKLSLRSIGDVPCNEIARKHFNGGGHFNAAGGSAEGDLKSVVDRFKMMLPEYTEILTK